MRPVRIGLIAPPWVTVPPSGYGGTEVVVDNLARALQERGHDVHVFTVGDSSVPVLRSWRYRHPVAPMGQSAPEAAHVLDAYSALRGVDVIHDHTMLGPLLSAGRTDPGTVVVSTCHGAFTDDARRIYAEVTGHVSLVAISAAQRATAPELRIEAVIHHGIDVERYQPGPGGGGYLLFIGRMCADKGVDRAIHVARRAGRRLVVVTKMRDADEQRYYADVIRPLLGPDIELRGELGESERLALLRHADALIDPIEWPEPFGLVMAEALACGTPVLAFPYGAAPEIVESGRTGFLCPGEDAMVEAVSRVGRIDRAACRAAAVLRFSMSRMAADHEVLYRRLLGGAHRLHAVR